MNILIVTAGVIIKDNKILIAQRRSEGEERFKWEFPGGKLEDEETPTEGLTREILEELDTEIEVLDIFEVVYHRYESVTVLLLCYLAKYIGGETKAIECKDFRWIKIDELSDYNLSDADIVVRDKIINRGLPKI